MNMNQAVQASNPGASSGQIPAKRKRGRPRKYPKLNPGDSSRIPKLHRTRWEENPGAGGPPPGFGSANGNPPRPVTGDPPDPIVGREVSGVIEAVFDAGYLLNVRVANSDTTLRGVVFRPGCVVPVSAENDVAPNVQMIRRIEIPAAAEHHVPRPRERRENYQVNRVGKPGQTALPESAIPRGNLVPVVLEPGGKSPNGPPTVAEPTPLATRAESNGSMTTSARVPTFGVEATLSRPRNENGAMPFENLVTEVIKRIETPSEVPTEAAPAKSGDGSDDADQALDIEPLQAVLIGDDSINELESAPVPVEADRTSKMTQLLEVLQGPISESPVAQVVEPIMTEAPSLVTEHVGKESDTVGEETITQESLF